ncbi:hypothetical protein [Paenibacillus sp. A3M_27_13]|uniref:hypothetical protein n=1 Tax=Paenibacillus sp. A3M_27_13 TaxID=2962029 RepID=UPI0020B82FC9|nr:hypothetical protein [Paenibacillus sp. A3M_27_13]MCP3746803.1 hypothetical protein [Paenibacillus sp. A3M_27_13]
MTDITNETNTNKQEYEIISDEDAIERGLLVDTSNGLSEAKTLKTNLSKPRNIKEVMNNGMQYLGTRRGYSCRNWHNRIAG